MSDPRLADGPTRRLLEGPIAATLLRLAAPGVIMLVAQVAINVLEAYFVGRLGPDVLSDDVDLEEVRRRARTRPPELALGELLLDQRVVAGIGNIWRSEALFLAGRNPWTERQKLTDDDLGALVATASSLMKASALGRGNGSDHWVYKRSGQPCRKCGTRIESRRQGSSSSEPKRSGGETRGEQARTAYWCPACQPV